MNDNTVNDLENATLPSWFDTTLGQYLIGQEADLLKRLIPDQYYQVVVQTGIGEHQFLADLHADLRLVIDQAAKPMVDVLAAPEALPLPENSADLVIMPHTLDFCDDPVSALREVSQVITPDGYLALSGFNRTSFWGCCRWANRVRRAKSPWDGRFYSVRQIQERLALLGFELVAGAMTHYQPPIQSEAWSKRLQFLDKAGDRWAPGLGAVYVLVLKKRVYGMNRRVSAHRSVREWLGNLAPKPVRSKNQKH